MTDTPPPIPVVFGPAPAAPAATTPVPAQPPTPPQRASRTGLLIAAIAVGVLALMASTGVTVYLLTRPSASAPSATRSAAATSTFTASGQLVLNRGEFVWNSESDPTCEGLNGYADLREGTQVTVTDAGGKKLVVGSLQRGMAVGITTDGRATSCIMKFQVSGVPAGMGPYGVEISHRGVQSYEEAVLKSTTIELGFS